MRRANAALAIAVAALAACSVLAVTSRARQSHPRTGAAITLPGADGGGVLLHSGWRISPAGRHSPFGDMLLGGAISPDGRTLAIANCGYGAHALNLLDVASEKTIATLRVPKAWRGIAWTPDSRGLYMSAGPANPLCDVYRFRSVNGGEWQRGEGIRLATPASLDRCVAGLALSRDGSRLYALNMPDGRLYVLDSASGKELSHVEVGLRPAACALAPGGDALHVANWGGGEVVTVALAGPGAPRVSARIRTPPHPNDIAVGAGARLYVSCGNANTVAVLDAGRGRQVEAICVALSPRAPVGTTPNALALSPDRRTLYVANADNNSVCVVDVADRPAPRDGDHHDELPSGRGPAPSRVLGFIPTGWYPSAVCVTPPGDRIIVCSGKGMGTRSNPARVPINPIVPAGFEYIARQLSGMVSFVDRPSLTALARYTREVVGNTPYRDELIGRAAARRETAVPARVGEHSPIRYVLYIIKENRTYDQLFGDVPRGNGDPSLCLFGREVTPNHHALAEQFVLLDNLYCNGEVSQDGHPWSTAAYVTDFTQRSWVLGYSGKGRLPGGNELTDSSGGFIWEACRRRGLSVRSYGEYSGHPSLEGNESLAYVGKAGPGSAPPGRDTDRADVFIREFREFERTGKVPRFIVISLGEDHTRGTAPGANTPKACVASNDLALGRIVEAVSRSRIWKECAILVIEDDAQNGPDHVDAHRTAGLLIGPYVRRGHLDSTMYTTTSMLRTMELILGLPPLSQYDAGAAPMYASFTTRADLTPYTALPARIDLEARNLASAYGAAQSARMDWSEYDRIDEDALNRILWHSIKGADAPYPAPVRSATTAVRLAAAARASEGR
ncbi:MAG: bifunctional YncE family protein/alkaline phosphatase family protein [Chthonomonadales bacterium]|nr:bifunctional YncE family protein/alkaline phosphatase family protein [Chthonomonadales bacterium]